MHTIHLPMPDQLHEALKAEAIETRRPASEIVREALDYWLRMQRKRHLADQIRRFAEEAGGSALDLDPDLEGAGAEYLMEEAATR